MKRISVRKRQVLFAVAAANGIASQQVARGLNITYYAARNALSALRELGLVVYTGTWNTTQAGKDWVATIRLLSTSPSSSSSPTSLQEPGTSP